MTQPLARSAPPSTGFLSLTLHAHLPYVIHHGTWPHGMEWLHEATAETYLPLLRVFANLERDGIALRCNLNLSPILLEQLAHPTFLAEFPKYLGRKIVAAREDEAFFVQSGEVHYAETARFWHRFFTEALGHFHELDGNIVAGFRRCLNAGLIDVVTCAATHGYLPLLGTDESVRAQIRLAVQTHERHLGQAPRGIWSPECGYRPAGLWSYPVLDNGATQPHPSFERMGIEQALAESHLDFFYVDTHLVEASLRSSSPYARGGESAPQLGRSVASTDRSLYEPYFVASHSESNPVTIFARDPRTGLQVWSGEHGYPGDGNYLDFHKKRWPGGHRYWRVTGANTGMDAKEPYYPAHAAERTRSHAAHFVQLVTDALASSAENRNPPILSAPFDAELFGHWWFEGPQWLEAVARELHGNPAVALISSAEYLDRYQPTITIAMPEGSWGAGGGDQVWMNDQTSWTWTHIYPAERYVRELCTGNLWRSTPEVTAIAQQLCRELLLLESSDWQFLITTGAARDYAELRFRTHLDQFKELQSFWRKYESTGSLSPAEETRLTEIQTRDSIFPDLDPSLWATPSAEPPDTSTAQPGLPPEHGLQ